ncbi:MAG: hypothetical protein WA957_09410 [Alteraurantiacibacter sp.]
MTNILLGIVFMIGGALLCATFVGILIGAPVFLLGMWLIVKGILGMVWGVGKAGFAATKAMKRPAPE